MDTSIYDLAKNLRILLVDDDSLSLRVIRHIIYGLGVKSIEEAFNGEEAKNLLDKHEFDLIITDVQMPRMNGLELIKMIRSGQTQAPRELLAIVVTALSNSDVLRTSLALDVNGFLAKPMKPIVVHEKIRDALNEKNLIVPKNEADYEAIDTDLKTLGRQHIQTSADLDSEKSQVVADQNGPISDPNRVVIRELEPGMRIMHDLRLKDGTLLLSAGYRLSETTINRLNELRDVLLEELVTIIPEEEEQK